MDGWLQGWLPDHTHSDLVNTHSPSSTNHEVAVVDVGVPVRPAHHVRLLVAVVLNTSTLEKSCISLYEPILVHLNVHQ